MNTEKLTEEQKENITNQLLDIYYNEKLRNTNQFNQIELSDENKLIFKVVENLNIFDIKAEAYNITLNDIKYDITFYINEKDNKFYEENDVVYIGLVKNDYEVDLPNIHHTQKKFFTVENMPSDDEIYISIAYTKEQPKEVYFDDNGYIKEKEDIGKNRLFKT